MIPRINSVAAGYIGDFRYQYEGFDFYFDFVNDFPQDYRIDESVYQSVIQAELSMDSMRIANQGYIISSFSNFVADISSLLYNAYFQLADYYDYLFVGSDWAAIKWEVTYNGKVGNNNLFSWTFSCPLGTQDLVLDSSGNVPTPSDHTYTTHESEIITGIVDDQIIDDQVYIPQNNTIYFSDLAAPYIVGKSLRFTIYRNGTPVDFELEDFTNTLLYSYNYPSGSSFLAFYNGRSNTLTNLNTGTSYVENVTNYSVFGGINAQGSNHGINVSGTAARFAYKTLLGSGTYSVNLPTYNQTSFGNNISIYGENSYGCLSNTNVPGTGRYIFLKGSNYNPVENPGDIVIPYDYPVPVDPIIEWPYENLPDDDPTGDPEPVDPYDPPIPIPVPSIPPIVSGNDDIWPDINLVFDIEADLDGFLGDLRSFQFTPLRTLVDGFTSAIVWVSSIMMLLYDGSDFSILFVVLSVFFIAAALLGIYKWWTH